MAIRALSTLKKYFKKYAYPTEQQFHDALDSFVHKDDKIGTDSLAQEVIDTFNNKAEVAALTAVATRVSGAERDISYIQGAVDALADIYRSDEGHMRVVRKGAEGENDETMIEDDAENDRLVVGNTDHATRVQGDTVTVRGESGVNIGTSEGVSVYGEQGVEIRSHSSVILTPNVGSGDDVELPREDGSTLRLIRTIRRLEHQTAAYGVTAADLAALDDDGNLIASSDGTVTIGNIAPLAEGDLAIALAPYTPNDPDMDEIAAGVYEVITYDSDNSEVTAHMLWTADEGEAVVLNGKVYLPVDGRYAEMQEAEVVVQDSGYKTVSLVLDPQGATPPNTAMSVTTGTETQFGWTWAFPELSKKWCRLSSDGLYLTVLERGIYRIEGVVCVTASSTSRVMTMRCVKTVEGITSTIDVTFGGTTSAGSGSNPTIVPICPIEVKTSGGDPGDNNEGYGLKFSFNFNGDVTFGAGTRLIITKTADL